ncbi:MAG: CvpA family protein [Gammaproteobacteria bacterium]|nr:CvpA family protein [Gammaproteobacteria bacterium]
MGHLFLNWNCLDYIIAGILLLSIIISFFRGFLCEAISLITWFLAFFAGLKFAPVVSALLHPLIKHEVTCYIVSVLLIFLIVLILGAIINKLVHSLERTSGLGFFDRLLGLVFGAARGFLFVTIILVAISASPDKDAPWMKQSQLVPYYKPLVTYFQALIPKEVRTVSSWIGRLTVLRSTIHDISASD